MENLKFQNILFNTLDQIDYGLESTPGKLNNTNLMKLSKHLFSGIDYIHGQNFSFDGKFELKDIYFLVSTLLKKKKKNETKTKKY